MGERFCWDGVPPAGCGEIYPVSAECTVCGEEIYRDQIKKQRGDKFNWIGLVASAGLGIIGILNKALDKHQVEVNNNITPDNTHGGVAGATIFWDNRAVGVKK